MKIGRLRDIAPFIYKVYMFLLNFAKKTYMIVNLYDELGLSDSNKNEYEVYLYEDDKLIKIYEEVNDKKGYIISSFKGRGKIYLNNVQVLPLNIPILELAERRGRKIDKNSRQYIYSKGIYDNIEQIRDRIYNIGSFSLAIIYYKEKPSSVSLIFDKNIEVSISRDVSIRINNIEFEIVNINKEVITTKMIHIRFYNREIDADDMRLYDKDILRINCKRNCDKLDNFLNKLDGVYNDYIQSLKPIYALLKVFP